MRNQFRRYFLTINGLLLVGFWLMVVSGQAGAYSPDREVSELVKKVSPAVVRVEVRNGLRRVATGVVIDKEGYVATTALISPRKEKLIVVDQEGKDYEAQFLGFDPETRIAFLQIKGKNFTAVTPGSARKLGPGSWVCALGISPDAGITVTQGIVSAVAEDRLRLNLWITPGMSGGPVLDEKGLLVGLLRGVYSEENPFFFRFEDRESTGSPYIFSRVEAPASGMAMAIPVELVMSVFNEIKTKGRVERGWLGVSIGEDRNGRVVITYVEEKSPAELVKLRVGDKILRVDGREIRGSDRLISEIRRRRPGQEITLTVEREGQVLDFKVKLGAVPEEEARRELELRFPGLFHFPEIPDLPDFPAFPDMERFEFIFEHNRYLGVYLERLNLELSKFFGVKEGRGLLVSRVSPGSPAEKAGLKVGDVIIAADGERVETLDALRSLIQKKKKGDKINLEIIRDKKNLKIQVEVEEGRRPGWPGVSQLSREKTEKMREIQNKSWGVPEFLLEEGFIKEFEEWLARIEPWLKEMEETSRNWKKQYEEFSKKNLSWKIL